MEFLAAKNEILRRTLVPTPKAMVLLTNTVNALPMESLSVLLDKVRNFSDFTEDNDHYGERDFGVIEHENVKYFFKIDAFDSDKFEYGFDPQNSDPETLHQVLTILRHDEY